MRGIVNDDVVGVISESADAKSDEQTQPPIIKSECSHCVCDPCLQDHNRDRNQRSPRIAHHQLSHFGVRFDDRPRPTGMRLIRFRLVKRGLHCLN